MARTVGDVLASGVPQQVQIRAPGVEELAVPGVARRPLDLG
ncbi:hypothetical protein AB0I06_14455 [Streptomyces sp. NPDC050674]